MNIKRYTRDYIKIKNKVNVMNVLAKPCNIAIIIDKSSNLFIKQDNTKEITLLKKRAKIMEKNIK